MDAYGVHAWNGLDESLSAEDKSTVTMSEMCTTGGRHPPSVIPQFIQSILPFGPDVAVMFPKENN